METEYAKIAQRTVNALSPHLLAAAGKTAEYVQTEATESVYNWVSKKLTREDAASALKKAETEEDGINIDVLRLQIQKELTNDEDFRNGLIEALADMVDELSMAVGGWSQSGQDATVGIGVVDPATGEPRRPAQAAAKPAPIRAGIEVGRFVATGTGNAHEPDLKKTSSRRNLCRQG